jgi:hypothetical protein
VGNQALRCSMQARQATCRIFDHCIRGSISRTILRQGAVRVPPTCAQLRGRGRLWSRRDHRSALWTRMRYGRSPRRCAVQVRPTALCSDGCGRMRAGGTPTAAGAAKPAQATHRPSDACHLIRRENDAVSASLPFTAVIWRRSSIACKRVSFPCLPHERGYTGNAKRSALSWSTLCSNH